MPLQITRGTMKKSGELRRANSKPACIVLHFSKQGVASPVQYATHSTRRVVVVNDSLSSSARKLA